MLVLWGWVLLPELRSGFRFGNDVLGVHLSLAMIQLLIPAGLLAIVKPSWGGAALALVGALGVLGTCSTPGFFHKPIYVGLGSLMFLASCFDGIVLCFLARRNDAW